MLSNDELKIILEKRLDDLETSPLKEEKVIQEKSVLNILKFLSLPSDFMPLAKRVFELSPRQKVVWLHLAECTGCSESLFRTDNPDLAEFSFDYISLDYHETLMLASGWQAEDNLDELLDSSDDFILAVEGGVYAIDTFFLSIGAKGESGYELLQKVAKRASSIFAIGTCSSYGGIQAANPNPSKCCGISEVLDKKVVHIPGCPPSDVNIIANIAFYALFKTEPNLDEKNRPKWAYGKCLHDMCERKAKFESGIFAQKFDDDLAKNGACLFKVGCKGPYTYNNCPKVKFNSKTSWPVQAGHGCLACCEPDFWDDFGFYEFAMSNDKAYMDYSFKSLNIKSLKENSALDDEKAVLSFDEDEVKILYKDGSSEFNFLSLSFESNVKVVFQNLAKNKMGASLLDIYKKEFPKHYNFINSNYDDASKPSSDIRDFFSYIYVLARGEFLKDTKDFFDYASAYKFKHLSPFDIKLSLKDDGAKIDLSKSMRMPLIYLCGGLDLESLAFSFCKDLCKNLNEALSFLCDKRSKMKSFYASKDFMHPFLHSHF